MTAALAVLFAAVAFGLTLAGVHMSEYGKEELDRKAGLFCVVFGASFFIGAIILGVIAFSPSFWS